MKEGMMRSLFVAALLLVCFCGSAEAGGDLFVESMLDAYGTDVHALIYFDDGFADFSPNALPLALVNGASTTAGNVCDESRDGGIVLTIGDSDDYLAISDSIPTGGNDFIVGMWFQLDASGLNFRLFERGIDKHSLTLGFNAGLGAWTAAFVLNDFPAGKIHQHLVVLPSTVDPLQPTMAIVSYDASTDTSKVVFDDFVSVFTPTAGSQLGYPVADDWSVGAEINGLGVVDFGAVGSIDSFVVVEDNYLTNSAAERFFTAASEGREFVRGDINGSGTADISDAFTLLSGGFFSGCEEAHDTNGDDMRDIGDGAYLLNYLFISGPPPGAPFPLCDAAPVKFDSLRCLDEVCP